MTRDLDQPDDATTLTSSITGLYVTPPSPMPYIKGGVARSFILEREAGNILLYNSPGLNAVATEIRELGAPDRLLLNHWHEQMYGAPDLDVPIHIHARDRAHVEGSLPIAATFSERAMIGDDLEIIPTPGHTSGTTTFLWDSGEHRILFTGDYLTVEGGEWKAVVLGESDREAYLSSLALLMELEFDFLVPWANTAGQPYGFGVTPAQARAHLEQVIARLEAGESR